MFRSVTNHTGTLARFILRRDRLRIPLWLIVITFFTLIIPIAFDDMYSSQQERDTLAETMNNPAMIAMVGPADLTNYTTGVMTAHNMLLFTAIAVGLMNILLVTRHTRTDEEEGRLEMIRSLPVGRLANINATLIVLVGTNLLLALINGLGLYALGIESIDLEGSLLYGATLGGIGILFAGVTIVFAQLSESSRGTIGYSITALLIVYLLRAIGDVSNDTLSLFSPLGWVTKTEPYANNVWWPILLFVSVAILLFILANYLNAIRDLEAGFIQVKPGKKNASRQLQSPLGLALRLQRTGIIAWGIGMFVIGISYGSVMGDLESFFAGNEMLEQMLIAEEGYSLTEQFIPMLLMVMGILATVPPIMSVNKLIGEEKKNRVEHLLARSVSRTNLLSSYLFIACINGFLMLSLAAIGLWSASAAVMEDGFSFGSIYESALAYYPAVLVMIGVALLFIGHLPKFTAFVWGYLAYSFFVLYLGGLFQFPDWVGKLSPFGYIPRLPIENMDWPSAIILTSIALLFIVISYFGYRNRDIEG